MTLKIVIKKSDITAEAVATAVTNGSQSTHLVLGNKALCSSLDMPPALSDTVSFRHLCQTVFDNALGQLQRVKDSSQLIPALLTIRTSLHKLHAICEWAGMAKETLLALVKLFPFNRM